jgi:GDP-L-fucose synthase
MRQGNIKMEKESKIFVAGHRGLVGSAIVKTLDSKGYNNLILRKRGELDLTRQADTEEFFRSEKPDYVFLAAAKVGGIGANAALPAQFIYENILIECNVINSAFRNGVKKLLNLGSSCIYPKFAPQPMKEEYFLSGILEPTNEPYAIAKIAGIKLCSAYNRQYGTDFICVMPTNLYGPNDNYNLETSHVLPAFIRKFHEAKEASKDIVFWGDGSPYREFLFSEDLAEAAVFLMVNYSSAKIGEFVNIGYGSDITIKELAELISKIIGFKGTIGWDTSKPNGTPRKLLDISRLQALGWKPITSLESGIKTTYEDFIQNIKEYTSRE